MNLGNALSEKVGPFPAWLLALVVGVGLYWLAKRQSQPTPPLSGPMSAIDCPECGSVAAAVGPVLQLNPMTSNGINTQAGAALAPGTVYMPNALPLVSGGDNPFVGGYVGLLRATPYDYARGGPS